MRTFAQAHRPKATHPTIHASSASPARTQHGRGAADSLLQMQRAFGQQADSSSSAALPGMGSFGHDFGRISVYARAPAGMQAKLMVNAPGDVHEQEADRVADQVMRMPAPEQQQIREHAKSCDCGGQCPTCKAAKALDETQRKRVQAKPAGQEALGQTDAPPSVDAALRSPSQPLDPAARDFLEPRFGHDFSQVRVHADTQAADASREVQARAFTVGQDIVFGAGQYAPQSDSGRQLIAHELAHVLQNSPDAESSGGSGAVQPSRSDLVQRFSLDDCLEADEPLIKKTDSKATGFAGTALSTLRQYATDYPAGKASQRVTDLLVAHFGFEGSGRYLDAVIGGYRKIFNKFLADDYQYECEDDCDDEHAYVYAFWTDIHLCMNKLKSRSEAYMAGVMLHEMSHYIAGTDDIQYYYSGSGGSTSLHPNDAISNADSYEGFAEELSK